MPTSRSMNELQEHSNDSSQFITFEIFYLFVKCLKFIVKQIDANLGEDLSSDDDDVLNDDLIALDLITNPQTTSLVEIICKYLTDFLLINNSYLLNKKQLEQPDKIKSTKTFHSLNESINEDLDLKLTQSFAQFINKNSVKINRIISILCNKLSLCLNISVSFSSQLILFQECKQLKPVAKNSIEQSLCKSIIDEISLTNLCDNELLLDTLLELYLKSSMFRFALNELSTFYSYLINCLNVYIANDNENIAYLELLLDLIFVYFYFNRKVMILFGKF